MLTYTNFYLRYGYRKVSDMRKIYSYQAFEELPKGSFLHWLDSLRLPISQTTDPLLDMTAVSKFIPESAIVEMFPIITHNTDDCIVSPEYKNIRQVTPKIYARLKTFRGGQQRLFKKFEMMQSNVNHFPIVSYDSLRCAKVTGMLPEARIFNITLAKLLTMVAQNPDLDHFVYIPVENIQLSPVDFSRSIRKYERTAYKYPTSFYYHLMMHIFGFLHEKHTESYFELLSEEVLSKLNLMLVNKESDKVVFVRLDRLKQFTNSDAFVAKKFLQVMNAVVKDIPSDRVIGEAEDDLLEVNKVVKVGETGEDNTTIVTGEITPEEEVEAVHGELVEAERAAIERVAKDDSLTILQKQRATENIVAAKKIELDGKPIEEYLYNATNELSIEDNDVSAYMDIPDKSVAKSTTVKMRQDYMKNNFNRSMASTLMSFTKLGMHLVELKTEDVIDELSEITKYTARFKDDSGKSHTIKYMMPKVDAEGFCKINGAKKGIIAQRVNTPICKVSPTRVSINASANKTIVERNVSFSNTIFKQVRKYLNKTELPIKSTLGGDTYADVTLPLDYASMGKHMLAIDGAGLKLTFDYRNRFAKLKDDAPIKALEKKHNAVYMGKFKGNPCFMDITGIIHCDGSEYRMLSLMEEVITDVTFTPYNEWVNVILLNKKFPVIFLLAYRFGFENILNYLKVEFEKVPRGARRNANVDDVVVKTYDVTYVIRKPSQLNRLLISGMNYFDLTEIEHAELDNNDAYFTMLQLRGYSIEYIRGIDFVFDLFLDPITVDVLRQMNEPTNMRDLLIRATVLLTTTEHKEAASSTNFRYRTYELFNAILYKTLARALSTYSNKSVSHKSGFTINEYEVFSKIMSDPTINNVDVVNPAGVLKEQGHFTHSGDGGRSKASIVVKDRRFPIDGTGIMSEATVDSGNVGIDGGLSVNANIINTSGVTKIKKPNELEAGEILGTVGLLYPGITRDDPRRVLMASVQMSQFLPVKDQNFARIRTGYERVVAHRMGLPFAYTAEDKGKVVAIDEELKMMLIEYSSGEQVSIEFGEVYSKHSSESMYITQPIVINDYNVNSRFKKGDVLVYNSAFFTNDPLTKQVDMGIGLFGNVALIDGDRAIEDASFMRQEYADKMRISPVLTKTVTIPIETVIHKVATVGTHVRSIDPIMIFDEADIASDYDMDEDTLAIMATLNKAIPKAKHTGKVVKIEVFYRCAIADMSKSLAKFVRSVTKDKNAKAKFSEGSANSNVYKPSKPLVSDRFEGVNLDDETVVIRFYIQEDVSANSGDKFAFGAQLKSVSSGVTKHAPVTEDGKIIDAVYGQLSAANRMVPSLFNQGLMENYMERVESDVLDAYFED